MLNQVSIMGRLTAPPKLETTENGTSLCRFFLAVDRDFSGDGKERTADFIPCTAWRQTAEFVCKYFDKGQLMAVSGRLRSNNWTDKDGKRRQTMEIMVGSAYFAGANHGQNSSQNDDQSDWIRELQDAGRS